MGCGASQAKVGVAESKHAATTRQNLSDRSQDVSLAVSPTAIPITRGNSVQQCALHILFSKHDRRKANTLDATDLASMLVYCSGAAQLSKSGNGRSPDSSDVQRIMRFIDEDGSGSIDRGEFLEWIESGIEKPAAALEKFAAHKVELRHC